MRILAFGDVHDEQSYYQDIDEKIKEFKPQLVIGVGDVVNYKTLVEYLKKGKSKFDFVFVHGNNDNLEDIKARLKKNKFMHYSDSKVKKIGKIKFLGIGGVLGKRSRNFTSKKLMAILKNIENFDILITHLDPRSKGSEILKEFVRDKKPKYWFHGHKHEDAGRIGKIGKTVVVNASRPVVMDLEL
jgi:Icc-related predicted phosphoesterase